MILIDTNAKEIRKQIDRVASDQLPFASALALTNVAAVGMREARLELGKDLVLRNTFSARGIQTDRANKRDWPLQRSKVGIEERRSYLIDQVLGGERTPMRSPFKGIPQTDVVPRGSSGKMPVSRRPKALIAKASKPSRRAVNYFMVKQGARELLFQRAKGADARLAYVFAKTAVIKPRFQFAASVERAVRGSYAQELTKAIDRAIETRR